jgi:hypothetical protein
MPDTHPTPEHHGSGPLPADDAPGEDDASRTDEQHGARPVVAAPAVEGASWASRGGRAWQALRSHVAALLSTTFN